MNSIIKYTIFLYIIFGFLVIYEINQAVVAKNVLEKKVKGISTQIKEIENYQNKFNALPTLDN